MRKKLTKFRKASKPNSNNLDKRHLFIFSGALFLYFFYIKTLDKIINYPKILFCSVAIVIFVCVFLIKIKALKSGYYACGNLTERFLTVLLQILTIGMYTWFLSGIVLIPFNYYNINFSKENSLETIYAPIESIYSRPREHVIYYKLNNRTLALYGRVKSLEGVDYQEMRNAYVLQLNVRKALFNSFVIEDWRIERK